MQLDRINITVTDDLLLAIDTLDCNRSEFFRNAAALVLGVPNPTVKVGRPRGITGYGRKPKCGECGGRIDTIAREADN